MLTKLSSGRDHRRAGHRIREGVQSCSRQGVKLLFCKPSFDQHVYSCLPVLTYSWQQGAELWPHLLCWMLLQCW